METPSFIETSTVTLPVDDTYYTQVSSDTVGAFPLNSDITVINPFQFKWKTFEEVGNVFMNSYSVNQIQFEITPKIKWVHVETPPLPKYWPNSIAETGRMFDME